MLSALIVMFIAIAGLIAAHLRPLAVPAETAGYARYFDHRGRLIDEP